MRNVNKVTALAGGTLAALLLASPIAAQTSQGGGTMQNGSTTTTQSAPNSYGNSGSTAAGNGTGASANLTNRGTGGGGGNWGIWGLIGLLGLFGVGKARQSINNRNSDLPRSSVPPSPPR